MPDPQATDFPNRPPYEGEVVARDDPKGLHRVKVKIPGPWEVSSPWVLPLGVGYNGAPQKGRFESPPLGATVAIFFINGNKENPRYLAGHHGVDEVPLDDSGDPLADVTTDGDNKVFQDERIRVEVDARAGTYGIRIADLQNNTLGFVDLDLYSGQLGVSTPLGILLKTDGHLRVEAGLVTVNGRPVLKGGPI